MRRIGRARSSPFMPSGYKIAAAVFAATTAIAPPRAAVPKAPSAAAMTSAAMPTTSAGRGDVVLEAGAVVIQQLPGEDASDLADRVVRELRRRALAQTGDVTRWSEVV